MTVNWTRTAEDHLDSIFSYIAKNSQHYALSTVDRITKRSVQIGAFPQSGRMVPEYQRADVREIFEGPYRIIYLIKNECIEVLAVLHGARLVGDVMI
jgi:plasmid stabilization system protein ParE